MRRMSLLIHTVSWRGDRGREREGRREVCMYVISAFLTLYYDYVIFVLFQSVWGSYWYQGSCGYACCHSLIKGSYCTGEAGRGL